MSNKFTEAFEEHQLEIKIEKQFPDYLFSADNALSWVGQSLRDCVEVSDVNGQLILS
jgi:hypothetical protein